MAARRDAIIAKKRAMAKGNFRDPREVQKKLVEEYAEKMKGFEERHNRK